MFDYIRTHQRLMQFVLLLIIFPSFVVGGVVGFSGFGSQKNEVAHVGSVSISSDEFDKAVRDQLDRLKQAYGQNFDAQLLNTPEARQNILDDLISRKALIAETAAHKLTVSDQSMQQNILETPGLKKADNSFDNERYRSLLAMQGMTPAMYESQLRQDLVLQQLISSVQATAITSKTVAERIALISEQEREVQALGFKAKDFAAQVKITDDMLRAYYTKNIAQFEIPEMLNAEYVTLSNDVLAQQVGVSDAEVQAHYDQNKKSYTTDELRRASHILLGMTKDTPEKEKQAVKAKADSLLAQVRKDPTQFAQLAKENSQDPGSKDKGGDLDFFKRGAMTKAFDDAVFKLKQGEISALVETEYGLHIIQLTDVKPSTAKSLDEVKADLTAEIKKQKASKAYAEAEETFSNTVYEQSESLQAVADKLKLKVEKIANLQRKPMPGAPATMIANNPKFLTAIFSDDSLKKKHNTEAISIAPNVMVSGRVVDYKPASKRPFDEVKAMIQEIVLQTESLALAKKAGESKLAALRAKDDASGFAEMKIVSRSKKPEVPNEAFMAIVKADVQKLPAYVGVEIPSVGYEVYRIAKVNAGTPDLARRAGEAKQLDGTVAQQDVYSYLEALKIKGKVKINQAALTAKSNANAPQ